MRLKSDLRTVAIAASVTAIVAAGPVGAAVYDAVNAHKP